MHLAIALLISLMKLYSVSIASYTGKVGKKAKGAMPKSRTGPLRRYYEHVKRKSNEYVKSFKSKISEDFYPDAVSTMAKGKIRMNVENIVNDTFGEDIEKAKEKVTEIIDQTFIRSQDPVSAKH